ncbi:biosynthetic-type acetolactate synthase large subunit [Carboxydothermus hydrogenoformans]|uniref:Acetolactate synthase n=1 Tax=Carboxydothermus hydrogenoformans (strain ATCC BAA-161 / DSM 6008 / Z-2901) TaxID=246194 RepID=Q3AEQ9_CARHZ|nr:biosynthetic-type acetolactate synthase large subunit [Carboxydothermus hydrogenoformans]ABB15575.1 acetolactate synthase, large subunit, biosynthetic type [Carboxydothermus hydrogenoformans Z-2901]
MELTGAQILIKVLEDLGVDTVFGYPGGAVLPIYDALYDSKITHYLTRHEQGAAHAADGYARASGKVGVCFATSGPGATNLVTGLATAYMDSVPVVAITGQVATSLLGRDSFQEADITGITMPITKHNYLVKDPGELAQTVVEAFYIARTGRPGPVLIDIPKDVSAARARYEFPEKVELPGYKPVLTPGEEEVNKAIALINSSERPLIFSGGGTVNAGAEQLLLAFAEKINAPVVASLMGLGGFPGDHPLFLGMLGMHGTKPANYAVSECDVLIAVGVRFDDRVTGDVKSFAPNAKIVHIDIDPAEINKNVLVEVPLVGDVKNSLELLIKGVKEKKPEKWLKYVFGLKEKYPLTYNRECGLKPQKVIETLYKITGGEAIIVTDVGQHQMWAAQFYKFNKPRRFISSGGLGTMGFGLPAGIGAQVARPEQQVIVVSGDGSIQMNSQELMTVAAYNIPVKVIILNNGYLGMVRQWQELFHQRRYSHTELKNPDFVKLADAYGIRGLRIKKEENLEEKLLEAINYAGPVVVDVWVDREENVFPMVPPGGAIHKMIG